MELQQIYELMERFQASGLTGLEWRKKDESILLRREVAAPTPAAAAVQSAPAPDGQAQPAPQEPGETVDAPLVGTFYAASAPGEEPFVAAGKQVKEGQVLCLIEAMKMMSQITAPADCVVEEVLVQDGAPVGYGQALFRIRRV